MNSSYQKALDYLYKLEKFGISLGLHKISAILSNFDNPQDKIKVIHIAGSNGKGSTAAFLEAILMFHGYNVGLYTSPHLVRFNERIRINQNEISDEDIVKYVNELKPIAEKVNMNDPVTFFDFTTAIAYKYFYDKKVDFAIMETGLGGTLDSTNIVKKPLLSIITNISLEHEEFLGNSLTDIAKEKGGIIKEKCIAVTGEEKIEALNTLLEISKNKQSKLFILKEHVVFENRDDFFSYKSCYNVFDKLQTNLKGSYQVKNASLAIFALEVIKFQLKEELLKKAFLNVKWEGRYEKVKENPLFIIDGAHNPDGAKVLKENIEKEKYSKSILIISVMSDKNIDTIFKYILPLAHEVIFTRAKIERAANYSILKEKGKKYNKHFVFIDEISNAIQKAEELATKDDLILFTGSLYAVGEAKEFLGSIRSKFTVGNKYK